VKPLFPAIAKIFWQQPAARNEIFWYLFIPSSETKCPKSVFTNYYVEWLGQSNFESLNETLLSTM